MRQRSLERGACLPRLATSWPCLQTIHERFRCRAESRRVLTILEPVKPSERSSRASYWPEYLRGHAFLQLKDGHSAAAEFKSIVDHRGDDPTSSLYTLARLGLARAQVLTGETANARQNYEAFLSAWSAADVGLAPLTQARAEVAKLN